MAIAVDCWFVFDCAVADKIFNTEKNVYDILTPARLDVNN